MNNIISFENLTLSIPNTTLLSNASFSIKPNEIKVLYQQSGSGKTTLFNAITGNISNTIKYNFIMTYQNKKYKNTLPKELNKNIFYMFQDIFQCFNPLYKISQQVYIDKINDTYLKKFNINMLNKYPHEYSGGELQKIILSIMLSNNKELFILDEPTSFLDDGAKELFYEFLLNHYTKYGSRFLIASHCPLLLSKFQNSLYGIVEKKIIKKDLEKDNWINTNKYITNILNPWAIEMKNYSLCVNNNTLLEPTNFTFYLNHITILIGENGAGKSSLASDIMGISKDSITTEGIINKNPILRPYYIFQNYSSHTHLPFKIIDILMDCFVGEEKKLIKFTKYRKILTLINLLTLNKEILLKKSKSISSGEQQKILIIRAILSGANFLVLDEVTSALDKKNEDIIIDIITKMHMKYKIGFIIISHGFNVQNKLKHIARVVQLKDKKLHIIPQ